MPEVILSLFFILSRKKGSLKSMQRKPLLLRLRVVLVKTMLLVLEDVFLQVNYLSERYLLFFDDLFPIHFDIEALT